MSDAAAQLFDRLSPEYDADSSHAELAGDLVALADEAFADGQPMVIFDVGTGTGAAALAASRRFPAATVTGLDISPAMIERARAAGNPAATDRLRWLVAPAVPLPAADESVDLVLCCSTVHFLGMPALRDWQRVLRPGGLAAFTLPWRDTFRPSPEFAALLPAEEQRVPLPASRTEAEDLRWPGFEPIRVAAVDKAALVALRMV